VSSDLIVLRDALARLIRASEAHEVGDQELAATIVDDLADDLWSEVELREREAA
jgi:hypothetical protein